MRLCKVEVFQANLSLRTGIESANETHMERPVTFVKITTDSVEGWGESSALIAGTSVDPPAAYITEVLKEKVVPSVVGIVRERDGELPDSATVTRQLLKDGDHPLAVACMEMALLDAELLEEKLSLPEKIGSNGTKVSVGTVLGIPSSRDLGQLISEVDRALESGWARIRLKVRPGWDVAPAFAVRRRFTDLCFQIDCNGSYSPLSVRSEIPSLWREIDSLGLACIEQPFAAHDLESHAVLAAAIDTPVCLDETLTSTAALERAIDVGACEIACLKPARLGGVAAARTALDLCGRRGIPAFVGGFFETGLARSVNVAVAGLAEVSMPSDVGAPLGYLREAPFSFQWGSTGVFDIPQTPVPGLGSHCEEAIFDEFATTVLTQDL
ncbi:MAG: hypothetical protein M1121_06250 [Actinobacteria bacterium]|nr:hypothetical protein [Actinomycetota bacterium]